MKLYFLFIILILLPVNGWSLNKAGSEHKTSYAVVEAPTPVFNSPDIRPVFGGADGKTLRTDRSKLIREIEFIAIPGSVFTVEDAVKRDGIVYYRVRTDEYPSERRLYLDGRFVTLSGNRPPERVKELPSRESIFGNLTSAVDSRYVWGGNYKEGVPAMSNLYPPSRDLTDETRELWELRGLDCTGLLYHATKGYTPRNTASLIRYGEPVAIKGLKRDAIMKAVRPLDLILWKKHLIIVLDQERIIESRLDYDRKTPGLQGGVRIRPLSMVLDELLAYKKPADDYEDRAISGKRFVIRRWISE